MRLPPIFLELSFSLSRLRTTPARKPRTECCCHPVVIIIAAMVAPLGDSSIAITRDCFDFELTFVVVEAATDGRVSLAAANETGEVVFFLCLNAFALRSLIRVSAASCRTTDAPPRPSSRRGRISECVKGPELAKVPLCLQTNASLFWIILLLVSDFLEHQWSDVGIPRRLWPG